MHNLVPKGQKRPSTRPKASVCTQTGPKGLYLICISISVCISYLYHCISISVCIPYLYHCISISVCISFLYHCISISVCISYLYHCISISVCIPYLYHCISISVCISFLYHCNHHTACLYPQKAKTPKHTAQSLYVCSDGPQRPLISYNLYHCIWREGYCLMISKTIIILIFTYLLIIL